jgi:hypothetical protein
MCIAEHVPDEFGGKKPSLGVIGWQEFDGAEPILLVLPNMSRSRFRFIPRLVGSPAFQNLWLESRDTQTIHRSSASWWYLSERDSPDPVAVLLRHLLRPLSSKRRHSLPLDRGAPKARSPAFAPSFPFVVVTVVLHSLRRPVNRRRRRNDRSFGRVRQLWPEPARWNWTRASVDRT